MKRRHGFISNSSSSSFIVPSNNGKFKLAKLDGCEHLKFSYDLDESNKPFTERELNRFIRRCRKNGQIKPFKEWLYNMIKHIEGSSEETTLNEAIELTKEHDPFVSMVLSNIRNYRVDLDNAYVWDSGAMVQKDLPFSVRDVMFAKALHEDPDALSMYDAILLF